MVDTVTISGTVTRPSGGVVTAGSVSAVLSTSGEALDAGTLTAVTSPVTATIDADGAVSIDLTPNDIIYPGNTFWQVTYTVTDPVAASWTDLWVIKSDTDPLDLANVTLLDAVTAVEDTQNTWTGPYSFDESIVVPGIKSTGGTTNWVIESRKVNTLLPTYPWAFDLRVTGTATNVLRIVEWNGDTVLDIPRTNYRLRTLDDSNTLAVVVNDTRTISTTAPLSGGGDLSANRTIELDLTAGINWTGAHTWSVETVHNGGIDVGTSGRFDSNVADGTGAVNFLFKPTTTLTDTDTRGIFEIQDQAGGKWFHVWPDGVVEIGGVSAGAVDAMMAVKATTAAASGIQFAPAGMSSAGATYLGVTSSIVGGYFLSVSTTSGAATAHFGGVFETYAPASKSADVSNIWAVGLRGSGSSAQAGNSARTWASVGGLKVFPVQVGKNSGTYTNIYGGYVSNVASAASGSAAGLTITNTYGLYLEEQTRGATINNGIFLANATSGRKLIVMRDQDIWIGSDADGYMDLTADTAVHVNVGANNHVEVAAAQTKIGDLANGDYVQIDHTDGNLTLVGGATVWEDLRIEPVARGTGANNPAFEQWADDSGLGDTGTSRGIYLYSFADEANAANEDEIFFTMQMPHAWASTAIQLHIHWIGSVSDTTSAPRWGLEYAWKDLGETFGATATIIYTDGSNYTAAGTDANVTAGKHYISKFSAITPGTTADGISSILIGRLFRNSSDGGDTYDAATNKCGLLYIDAHYEVNSLGSNSEYTK